MQDIILTEQSNPNTVDIDLSTSLGIVEMINNEVSATGGFIMAFAAVALVYFVASFFKMPRWGHYILAAACLALIYFGGSAWFVYMMGGSIKHALLVCVVPFILPDVIKITLAFLLADRLAKIKQ